MKKEKKYLTWNDFEEDINLLTERIKASEFNFDGVYGIPRGGLIIAVCLSHRLGLPLLDNPTKYTLVVDDISDFGKTLMKYKDNKIVCWVSTPWTKVPATFYCRVKISKKNWIIFPWECDE